MRISKFHFVLASFLLLFSSVVIAQSTDSLFQQVKIIYGSPAPYVGLNSELMEKLKKANSTDAAIQRYLIKFEDLQEKINDYRLEHGNELKNNDEIFVSFSDKFSLKERNVLNAFAIRNGLTNPREYFDETIIETNKPIIVRANLIASYFAPSFYMRRVPSTENVFKVKFLIERKEYNNLSGEWFRSEVLKSFKDTPFKLNN